MADKKVAEICKRGKFCDGCDLKHEEPPWAKCANYGNCKDENCKDRHKSDLPCHKIMNNQECDGDCDYSHDEETIEYWQERNASSEYRPRKKPCHYGDHCKNPDCKFYHPKKYVNYDRKSDAVCEYFNSGHCKYGDRCFKKHERGNGERTRRVHSEEPIPAIKKDSPPKHEAHQNKGEKEKEVDKELALQMMKLAISILKP